MIGADAGSDGSTGGSDSLGTGGGRATGGNSATGGQGAISTCATGTLGCSCRTGANVLMCNNPLACYSGVCLPQS